MKTERGQRVFPVSDKSSDVIRTLERVLKDRACLDSSPTGSERSAGLRIVRFAESDCPTDRRSNADAVIIAAGGMSLILPQVQPGTVIVWRKHAGHHVTKRVPSLVPMTVADEWCPELQGLSLKNITFIHEMRQEEFLSGIWGNDVYAFWYHRTCCIERKYTSCSISEERNGNSGDRPETVTDR